MQRDPNTDDIVMGVEGGDIVFVRVEGGGGVVPMDFGKGASLGHPLS